MKCPRCGTETEFEGNPHRPFCSERCRLIDLGRWLSGDYAIPAAPDANEEGAAGDREMED